MSATPYLQLQTRKGDPRVTRVLAGELPSVGNGEILVSVEAFAFTANNVTYAMFGDAMNYWQFYPTGDADWGTIPVWGFATVVDSTVPGIESGERFYGYLPTASHAVLKPERVSPGGFVDAVAHRVALPAVYNQYSRCSTDSGYIATLEAQQMLLRPLFMTSFLIDDFLADNAMFGASRIVLSSASSKTAYGTAFCLAQRPGIEVVGLTSTSNRAFVESLGCYQRVVGYDDVATLATDVLTVYVDFSGSVDVRRQIHTHLGDALKYSASIGGTDWQHIGKVGDLPGPRPTLFFAPSQVKKRIADWGGAQFQANVADAWKAFMRPVTDSVAPWLVVRNASGLDAARAAYDEVVSGRAKPAEGHILSLST